MSTHDAESRGLLGLSKYNSKKVDKNDETISITSQKALDTGDVRHAYLFRSRRTGAESPKKVYGRPWNRILASAMVHFVPVIMSIVLLCLNFTHYFWYGANSSKKQRTVENLLQFVAKLHELLVIGSLTAMILHHCRRHLLTDGLPFGFLSIAYRLSNIEMFTQSACWSVFRHEPTRKLGFVVLGTVLLSVLVGPSAAVAYIPISGYYPMPHAFTNNTGRILWFQTPLRAPSNNPKSFDLWRTQMSNDIFSTSKCSTERECPAGTFKAVLQWQRSYWGSVGDYYDLNEAKSQLSYQAVSTSVDKINGEVLDDNVRNSLAGLAVGTAPNEYVIASMGRLWQSLTTGQYNPGPVTNLSDITLQTSKNSLTYQAVVQTKCNWFGDSRKSTTTAPEFRADGTIRFDKNMGWDVQEDAAWQVPQAVVDQVMKRSSEDQYAWLVEWVNATDLNAADRISIAALFSFPIGTHDAAEIQDQNVRLLMPCVMNAYWMPSTYIANKQAKVEIVTEWNKSPNRMVEAIQKKQTQKQSKPVLPAPLDLIKIDANWAAALEAGNYSNGDKTLATLLSLAANNRPRLNATDPSASWDVLSATAKDITAVFSIGLGNYGADPTAMFLPSKGTSSADLWTAASFPVVNGLTSFGVAVGMDPVVPPPAPLTQTVEFEIEIHRYGYAWGGSETGPRFFALIVTMAYLIIFVGYVSRALWDQFRTHPYPIMAWGRVEEMFALAMNSTPPTELENCGAGVGKWSTWKNVVKVRVADQKEQLKLEMVFNERSDHTVVSPMESYS